MPDPKATFALSPSQLSSFKESPRYFWLWNHRKSRRPQGIFSSMPNAIDRIMKARLDEHRAKGILPTELRSLEERGVRLVSDAGLIKELRSTSKKGGWVDPETGCTLFGALDDAVAMPGGSLAPFDVKTSRHRDDWLEYAIRYTHTAQSCYSILLGETTQGRSFGTHTAAFLAYYYPVYAPGAVMTWGCSPVEMPVDKAAAIDTFRAAVACLRGPMPLPGPDEAFDTWAIDYARLVREELKEQAAAAGAEGRTAPDLHTGAIVG